MEYIRRILEFLAESAIRDGSSVFEHRTNEGDVKMITVHATPDGFIVLTVMTPEEYSMVWDIVELSGKSLEQVIREFDSDGVFATIEFDPKEF